MDEIARKRKTKALEEISEILVGMNAATNKICDWVFSFLNLSNLFYDDVKELAKETTP